MTSSLHVIMVHYVRMQEEETESISKQIKKKKCNSYSDNNLSILDSKHLNADESILFKVSVYRGRFSENYSSCAYYQSMETPTNHYFIDHIFRNIPFITGNIATENGFRGCMIKVGGTSYPSRWASPFSSSWMTPSSTLMVS